MIYDLGRVLITSFCIIGLSFAAMRGAGGVLTKLSSSLQMLAFPGHQLNELKLKLRAVKHCIDNLDSTAMSKPPKGIDDEILCGLVAKYECSDRETLQAELVSLRGQRTAHFLENNDKSAHLAIPEDFNYDVASWPVGEFVDCSELSKALYPFGHFPSSVYVREEMKAVWSTLVNGMTEEKSKWVLVGSTGVGKTVLTILLSFHLAQKYNTPVVLNRKLWGESGGPCGGLTAICIHPGGRAEAYPKEHYESVDMETIDAAFRSMYPGPASVSAATTAASVTTAVEKGSCEDPPDCPAPLFILAGYTYTEALHERKLVRRNFDLLDTPDHADCYGYNTQVDECHRLVSLPAWSDRDLESLWDRREATVDGRELEMEGGFEEQLYFAGGSARELLRATKDARNRVDRVTHMFTNDDFKDLRSCYLIKSGGDNHNHRNKNTKKIESSYTEKSDWQFVVHSARALNDLTTKVGFKEVYLKSLETALGCGGPIRYKWVFKSFVHGLLSTPDKVAASFYIQQQPSTVPQAAPHDGGGSSGSICGDATTAGGSSGSICGDTATAGDPATGAYVEESLRRSTDDKNAWSVDRGGEDSTSSMEHLSSRNMINAGDNIWYAHNRAARNTYWHPDYPGFPAIDAIACLPDKKTVMYLELTVAEEVAVNLTELTAIHKIVKENLLKQLKKHDDTNGEGWVFKYVAIAPSLAAADRLTLNDENGRDVTEHAVGEVVITKGYVDYAVDVPVAGGLPVAQMNPVITHFRIEELHWRSLKHAERNDAGSTLHSLMFKAFVPALIGTPSEDVGLNFYLKQHLQKERKADGDDGAGAVEEENVCAYVEEIMRRLAEDEGEEKKDIIWSVDSCGGDSSLAKEYLKSFRMIDHHHPKKRALWHPDFPSFPFDAIACLPDKKTVMYLELTVAEEVAVNLTELAAIHKIVKENLLKQLTKHGDTNGEGWVFKYVAIAPSLAAADRLTLKDGNGRDVTEHAVGEVVITKGYLRHSPINE